MQSLPAGGERMIPLLWKDPAALELLHGTELESKVQELRQEEPGHAVRKHTRWRHGNLADALRLLCCRADTESDYLEHVAPLAEKYPSRIPR
jgi:hypothetical protein